jgi:hypothetical protein
MRSRTALPSRSLLSFTLPLNHTRTALREGVAREVIDRVRGSGLLFAYYPDQEWLESSRYLGDCAARVVESMGAAF